VADRRRPGGPGGCDASAVRGVLLAGWVGGAAALFAAYLAFADEKLNNDGLDIGATPILLFGSTPVALLVVAVLDARAEPARATA
jgi:hypothetical protein